MIEDRFLKIVFWMPSMIVHNSARAWEDDVPGYDKMLETYTHIYTYKVYKVVFWVVIQFSTSPAPILYKSQVEKDRNVPTMNMSRLFYVVFVSWIHSMASIYPFILSIVVLLSENDLKYMGNMHLICKYVIILYKKAEYSQFFFWDTLRDYKINYL